MLTKSLIEYMADGLVGLLQSRLPTALPPRPAELTNYRWVKIYDMRMETGSNGMTSHPSAATGAGASAGAGAGMRTGMGELEAICRKVQPRQIKRLDRCFADEGAIATINRGVR